MADTIALIFDFDDTLLPDSTSELLCEHGIDPAHFWSGDARHLLDLGYEPTFAYLNLLLRMTGKGKPLGLLSNKNLRDFGATLDSRFYPGVKTLFRDLRNLVREVSADITIEFYIISGGLQDVIEGNKFIMENFSHVYGCQFGSNPESGVICDIKRAITFTEKTRYIFEINKGIRPDETHGNQYVVNKDVPERERRIPLKNMIYVGDGLTDIPCFSLLKKAGGTSFGIFRPEEQRSARKAFLEFLQTGRVLSTHSAKYAKNSDLGSLLRAAITTIAQRIKVGRKHAESD